MTNSDFIKKKLNFSKKINSCFIKNFYVFDELSSTNAKAKELVKDDDLEGTVVIARMQKTGRGRFDRIWESQDG